MATDLKTLTPDTSLDANAYLFGADSQSSANPSLYQVSTLKTLLLGAGSVSIASGKTLTASNSLTLAGTDSTTMTFPSSSGTVATLNAANAFTVSQAMQATGDTMSLALRASSGISAANILEIQNASNAFLAGFDKTGILTLGAATRQTGTLKLAGTTSGTVTLSVADAAGTWTMKLPATAGTNNYVLATDGSGNTSWVAQSGGGGTPGGTTNSVQVNNGSSGFTAPTSSLILGGADAATATNLTVSVPSISAGTSNTAGASLTIAGSKGTGNAAGGSIIFQVAPAGSSGTAQNALATALTIASDKSATFGGSIKAGPNSFIACAGGGYGINFDGSTSSGNGASVAWDGSSLDFYSSAYRWSATTSAFKLNSSMSFGWTATQSNNALDTILTRAAVGVVKVAGASSAGGTLQFGGYTYSTLPASPAAGMIAYVTDGGAASYAVGDTVSSGSGSTKVLVAYTGAAWKAFMASF